MLLPRYRVVMCKCVIKYKNKDYDKKKIHFVFFNVTIYKVFQVAPSLHMVEVRKAKGDTLEFHKVC